MDFDSIIWKGTPSTIVILLTAHLAVLFVGLLGNVLVIVVVMKIPQMKTATNYFILNLAIADLLVLIFWLLTSTHLIFIVSREMKMISLMCKAGPYIQAIAVCASAYSLAAISGGRLMATWFALRSKVTKNVARRINVMIWIWAAGLNLPFLILFYLTYPDEKEYPSVTDCIESRPPLLEGNIYFVLVHLGLFYLFPLSFISFCYFGIWLRLRRRNVPTDASASHMELVLQRTKASVHKSFIVVVAGLAVSWLPLYVILSRIELSMLAPLGETEKKVLKYALPIAEWVGFANSCMNPIFYLLFNSNFRFALKRLLRGHPTYTRPMSCPNPHLLNNRNQAARCRTNFVRVNVALHQSNRRSSQLNSTRQNASDRRVSDVVLLHQKSPQLPAISRSQTF